MAKFIYRMQGILNVKEKLESQAKNEFALASAALAEEEKKLDVLIGRYEDYESELARLYSDKLDLSEISNTQNAIENIKYQIRLQKLKVKSAQRVLEEARLKLQDAMQERKTHDKLKEKEFEQFVADEAAKESKEIDELVSFRFGNKDEE